MTNGQPATYRRALNPEAFALIKGKPCPGLATESSAHARDRITSIHDDEHMCDNGVTCRWESCARNTSLIGVFRGRYDPAQSGCERPPVRPGHPLTGVAFFVSVRPRRIVAGAFRRFWKEK